MNGRRQLRVQHGVRRRQLRQQLPLKESATHMPDLGR